MKKPNQTKQSLYFPADMLKEIRDETARQDRTISWIMQQAWKISRRHIATLPSVPGNKENKP